MSCTRLARPAAVLDSVPSTFSVWVMVAIFAPPRFGPSRELLNKSLHARGLDCYRNLFEFCRATASRHPPHLIGHHSGDQIYPNIGYFVIL